jgi:hypothetical protein
MGKVTRKRYLPVDVVKASVWVRPELLEHCRNAVAFISQREPGYSFVKMLDDALSREVQRLEKKHRGGRSFPVRREELKRGARSRRVDSGLSPKLSPSRDKTS